MKFTEHRDSNVLAIKRYQAGEVVINDQKVLSSCYLTQHYLHRDWACKHISELNTERLDELLKLNPEVIILGTGETQTFPDVEYFAYCAKQGVGLEVMNNTAASRTFNVLTTEDREVLLALIMEEE